MNMKQANSETWKSVLANAFRDIDSLLTYLQLESTAIPVNLKQKHFPLMATKRYVEKIKKLDPDDPLLLQILPLAEEAFVKEGYEPDPLNESNFNPLPGLLHKYPGRVLLTLTSACAIHCRFCFRQHFPYGDNRIHKDGFNKICAYLRADPNIHEVILSGGDPLLIDDDKLLWMMQTLEQIQHIKTIRMHSRVPLMLPERITETFMQCHQNRFKKVLIIHCNHPHELDQDIIKKLAELRTKGFTLLNQHVLLNGVNDDVKILSKLYHRLFEAGVLPYYIHKFDKVAGGHRFYVSNQRAHTIVRALQSTLPGYLVPKYVEEQPGKSSKTLLNPV